MAEYSSSSPYFTTPQTNNVLQLLGYRAFSFQTDDILYKIDSIYDLRPDLLAYDQYANANLWWVFVHRNPDVLFDPIWDFTEDKKIYIPKLSTILQALG